MHGTSRTVSLTSNYDGIQSRPFLAEHWYKGLVAAIIILFLLTLLFSTLFNQPLWIGVLAAAPFSLLFLGAVVTQHQRFELDANRQRYRTYLWVLGLRFGDWKPLPIIYAVAIRRKPYRHILPLDDGDIPIGIVATEDKWQVLLRVVNSPVSIVAAYIGQEQATRIANTLSTTLGIEIEEIVPKA